MKMPASPSKHGKALNQHNSLEPHGLQIRVVPYTPPRLSTDGAAPPCPVSPQFQDQADDGGHAVADNSNLRLEPNYSSSPDTDRESRDGFNSDVAAQLANTTNPNSNPTGSSPAPLAPISPSPLYYRGKKVISVNPDKTFSLLRQVYPPSSAPNLTHLPRRASAAPSSSTDRTVSDSVAVEQPSSPLTTLLESSPPCSENCTRLPCKNQAEESSSPWNYKLRGGLRKVPKGASPETIRPSRNAVFLAGSCSEHDFTTSDPHLRGSSQSGNIVSKEPLHSPPSTSTLSETDDETLSHETPCPNQTKRVMILDTLDPEQMSASSARPNIEVLGESSSEQSFDDQSRPRTSESNCNYVLHQDSTSSSPIVPTLASPLNTEYSRESLVVAPLRPVRRHIANQISISSQRSRDSVRTRSSVSIPSPASIETFAADTTVSGPSPPAQHEWNVMMSTVVLESEKRSEVPSSRVSHTTQGNFDGEHASHATSMKADLNVWHSETWIDRPQPAYLKNWTEETNSSSLRLIGDQDEHGDGLVELGALRRHPSRTRLHSYLSSIPSDRGLRSAGSSHSYSFSRSYIPTWARVYYGGGERRLLSVCRSSESLYSNFAKCAHHSPKLSRSTNFQASNSVKQTYHQRRASAVVVPTSPTMSNHGDPIPYHQLSMIRRIRKQTSSIWSPHLRRDRRAQMHSIWRPPSIRFAAQESKLFRDRIQLVLFVLGFVFPFAWMVASFLPLPSRNGMEFREKAFSTSHVDLEQGINVQKKIEVMASYRDREKWWRTLNRYMSIIGVFVIGAVLALTITGTRQQ
ncbi:hypothetical protein E4U43_000379 [Claviceps pusilla]|uniref:Serine-rich protein n=1 Tax=Claviceps pusilla TaxID=123648 RepID=A0A9P7NIF3_9HYPO|nr:hypothetical protein E4U43_000379 [Claviceps pusilla]